MSTTYKSSRPHSEGESRRVSGVAFPRMFSGGGAALLDATLWERRALSNDLPEVEVPAEWSNEAALDFLRGRGGFREGAGVGRKPQSIRLEIERLLTGLRGAALRGGYFARAEDAAIFAEEVGALLLSGRAVLLSPIVWGKMPENPPEAWRWDAARGVCAREAISNSADGNGADFSAQRLMTLDDADLPALLAGRELEGRRLLVLTDELMEAAAVAAWMADGTSRSVAGELLECIAAAALERGSPDLLFAETARRASASLAEESEPEGTSMVAAGAAELDLLRFLTADKQLDLRALRHATSLLVTALEIGVDGKVFPDEAMAVQAHNERRLAIGVTHLQQVLKQADVDPETEAADAIAAGVAAVLSGEGWWQSARLAESCPAIRTAVPGEQSGLEDAAEQNAPQVGEGACPAFRAHRERLLASLRERRAEAYRLVTPEARPMARGATPIHEETSGAAHERRARTSTLVRQLPELLACAREVWDGALMEAQRSGVRQCGVAGRWRVAAHLEIEERDKAESEAPSLAIEMAITQLRLLPVCQPFADAPFPVVLELPETTSAAQLAVVIVSAWKCGLAGLSVRQRERLAQPIEAGSDEDRREEMVPSQGGVEELMEQESAGAAEWPGIKASGEGARSERNAAASTERNEAANEGPSLEGMTLAEAERAAVARNHATLVETQLHRISELEEQLKVIQARARESGETHDAQEPPRSMRHRLPAERASVTHKFSIAGHEGYITVGLYPNGSPGEIFLRMTKEGSAVSGLLDSFATGISLALQHGVPVRVLAQQFAETRFEPSGATTNEQIPYALSIMDYLFRWIELRFLSGHQMDLFANLSPSPEPANAVRVTGTISGPKSSVVPHLASARTGAKP